MNIKKDIEDRIATAFMDNKIIEIDTKGRPLAEVLEDTVTIIYSYIKDEKGVWYRWKLPNDSRWKLRLTGLKELPYIEYQTMSKTEFKENYENKGWL